jgi:hypothetical protein
MGKIAFTTTQRESKIGYTAGWGADRGRHASIVAARHIYLVRSGRALAERCLCWGVQSAKSWCRPGWYGVCRGRASQLFGQNGPTVQFGVRQGPSSVMPFSHFQGSGYNAMPPELPYSRPLGNGN